MIICDKCGFGHKTFEEKRACKSWDEIAAELKVVPAATQEQPAGSAPQWNIEQILVYIWQCIGGEDSDPKEYPYSQFAESEGGKLLRSQMEGLADSPRKVGEDGALKEGDKVFIRGEVDYIDESSDGVWVGVKVSGHITTMEFAPEELALSLSSPIEPAPQGASDDKV